MCAYPMATKKIISGGETREFIPIEEAQQYPFFKSHLEKEQKAKEKKVEEIKKATFEVIFLSSCAAAAIGAMNGLLAALVITQIYIHTAAVIHFSPILGTIFGSVPAGAIPVFFITFIVNSIVHYNKYCKAKKELEDNSDISINDLEKTIENEKNAAAKQDENIKKHQQQLQILIRKEHEKLKILIDEEKKRITNFEEHKKAKIVKQQKKLNRREKRIQSYVATLELIKH